MEGTSQLASGLDQSRHLVEIHTTLTKQLPRRSPQRVINLATRHAIDVLCPLHINSGTGGSQWVGYQVTGRVGGFQEVSTYEQYVKIT